MVMTMAAKIGQVETELLEALERGQVSLLEAYGEFTPFIEMDEPMRYRAFNPTTMVEGLDESLPETRRFKRALRSGLAFCLSGSATPYLNSK